MLHLFLSLQILKRIVKIVLDKIVFAFLNIIFTNLSFKKCWPSSEILLDRF